MKYLVSHQGQECGPFTVEELVARIKTREIDLLDYVFDEQKQDWVLLMEHAEVAAKVKNTKPPKPSASANTTTPTMAAEPTAHDIGEWFILKGEHRFGPFGYTDVVRMLQQKVVFPFDLVWHAGMENWTRAAELEDFQPERIRQLYAHPEVKEDVFVARRFNRKSYNGRVIVHDNLSVWKGEGFEISKGGVGLTMSNALIVPGQHLHVHFKGHEDWPAFNAVCEVVSKKFVKNGDPIQYGLKFVSLSQEVQDKFYKKVA